MTQRVYVDRSRYETAQACRRRRWLEYHEGGGGIVAARKPLPLAFGGAVHEGLAVQLREGQMAVDMFGSVDKIPADVWMKIEEHAVTATLADFAAFESRLALEPTEAPAVEVTEYDRYLFAEQSAMAEAMQRAYRRRKLRPLLEQFTVLEVEREGQWRLDDPSTDVSFDSGFELWFMSRPDALLLEKSSGQLYLQSFKTTSGWDVRRARDAEHDMQGLSEGVEVERRLADWYAISRGQQPTPAEWPAPGLSKAMWEFLLNTSAPPRILAIRYEYLLKGERWRDKDLAARFGFDARAQRSPLVRGYLNAGMAAGDEQWNVAWDYLKGEGTGETSKLNYRAWKSAPVWESMPIAKWVTMLDESAMAVSGDTGGELGYKSAAQATGYLPQHPLDEVFLPPIVIYRNDDDLRDLVEQMEANERRVAEGVAAVNATTDEGERRSALNRHFPQSRRSCFYPSTCPFTMLCFGGEDIRREPLQSGLYKIRVPNHPQEGGLEARAGSAELRGE